VVALVLLILVEFVYRGRMDRRTYYWFMLMGLFVLPFVALTGTTSAVLEGTKPVESCAQCHVMDPFVQEMRHEEGTSLAARHYKNRWIETNQCHQCHTGYGAQGDLAAKRDGFRHWAMYVTSSWPEPIEFRGSYPNENCLNCHMETKSFQTVPSNQALSPRLVSDDVSCATCHGPPHPPPGERSHWAEKARGGPGAR
jgi:nitrate/TMAO reductase-like tetraheme cytochrome c subunit